MIRFPSASTHGGRRLHGLACTLAAVLVAIACAASVLSPALAQDGPLCSRFDSGLDGFGPCADAPNVTVARVVNADGLDPSNPYMRLIDRPNASRVCSTDPKYTGDWLKKMNGCGQLCYDFRVFHAGYPPSPITPSISLVGGGGRATYYAGFQVAVGDTQWHHICAPVADGDTPPPGTGGGHWVVTGASWHQIITNVTTVQLPIDFTSQPSEEVGYDNICMTGGDCGTPPPPPPPQMKGCLEGTKVAVACSGGTYTVTLSGGSFSGDTITLAAQTPGVTVSPAQQPWAPTMTFTLSGAGAGQTVTLYASATRSGGGSAAGTDECCSGEITIVLPECPKDTPVDVAVKKDGSTTPAQQPYYAFTLTITNNGASFAGANAITVTDVLPSGMTFNTVTAAPPGDWSCPASVAAGGTLVCTYTGSGPVGTGVIGTLTISATAGGSAPYPPIENCVAVGVSGGLTDTDASNNKACVTVSKPGATAELIVTKTVEYVGPLTLPSLTYPISVQCGGTSQVFNLQNTQTGSLGNIPLNTACQITETPPTVAGACPPNSIPTWATTVTPASPVTLTTAVTHVAVHNKLSCEPDHATGGTLQIVKTVTNETEADLSATTFSATANCGGTTTPLTLSAATPQTVSNLAAGTVCSVSETPPPPPATGCGTGRYPAWDLPTITPATVTIPAGGTATITVANRLICERGGNIRLSKTVVNNTQADVSGTLFPVQVTCTTSGSPSTRSVQLAAGTTQLLHNVVIGSTCTPLETLPSPPSGGCPAGSAPAWGTPTYVPASVTTVAGSGPTLTVQNTLNCVPTTVDKPTTVTPATEKPTVVVPPIVAPRVGPPRVAPPPPRRIICRPPLIANADGDACVCRQGLRQQGGRCLPQVVCVEPAFRNALGTSCLCPKGMDRRGNTCVRPQNENPRLRPPGVIHVVPGFGGVRRDGGRDTAKPNPGGKGGQGNQGGGKPAGVN